MAFYENFLRLCNQVGKSPSKVLLEIGGTKSAVTRWKKGGNPTDATAMKIADYFGVTVDSLLAEQSQRTTEGGPVKRRRMANHEREQK